MNPLVGTVYQSGHIEFARSHNPWAFRRIDKELRSGQEDRIVVKPELAPIRLELAKGLDPKEFGWVARIESLMRAADLVYLQCKKDALRFRRAVHYVRGEDQQLVTLGTQQEVDSFAKQHWSRLRRFFAARHDGFHFDLTMLVTAKQSEPARKNRIEIIARLLQDGHGLPRVSFHATGSHADVQIIEWRSSIPEGESGRFEADGTDIGLKVTHVVQPITFLYEYRPEFHNRAFIFSEAKVEARVKRVLSGEKV